MKKARIINAAIFSTIGVALTALVCFEWKKQGCGWDSIWVAIMQYGLLTLGFWYLVDSEIKKRY